jgi:hypothetical protein
MGFLDNLENSLKALEGRDEFNADPATQEEREAARQRALAAAPYAEKLKSGAFTDELLKQATAAGFRARVKVHFSWMGTTLRLQARERKLDLKPTADGVMAVWMDGNTEVRTSPVELEGDPGPLVASLLE